MSCVAIFLILLGFALHMSAPLISFIANYGIMHTKSLSPIGQNVCIV